MDAQYNKWYYTDKDTDIKPNDGDMVIYAIWYDGPNYETGMYDANTDKIILQDNKLVKDCTRVDLSDTQVWMSFKEPNFF